METVYTIAFLGNRFLMVYNNKRKGWEMPGGKIEKGETPTDAAAREYLEESGYAIKILSVDHLLDCYVCSAELENKIAEGEMVSKLFETLPSDLAFGADEYIGVIEWASAKR